MYRLPQQEKRDPAFIKLFKPLSRPVLPSTLYPPQFRPNCSTLALVPVLLDNGFFVVLEMPFAAPNTTSNPPFVDHNIPDSERWIPLDRSSICDACKEE